MSNTAITDTDSAAVHVTSTLAVGLSKIFFLSQNCRLKKPNFWGLKADNIEENLQPKLKTLAPIIALADICNCLPEYYKNCSVWQKKLQLFTPFIFNPRRQKQEKGQLSPPIFKLSKMFWPKFFFQMHNILGVKIHCFRRREFRGKIKIISNRNHLCRIFSAACRKTAIFYFLLF